MERNQSYLS